MSQSLTESFTLLREASEVKAMITEKMKVEAVLGCRVTGFRCLLGAFRRNGLLVSGARRCKLLIKFLCWAYVL